MSPQESVVELAELLADHRPDKWPWGCDCGGMAMATERTHGREHRRHVAEVILAAGYEKRPEHVHSWMTLHGRKRQCYGCREVRDTHDVTDEEAAETRAYFDEIRKRREG